MLQLQPVWGKKRAKTGISTVPRPNPEKNVEADTTNATEQTTAYSIFILTECDQINIRPNGLDAGWVIAVAQGQA